MMPDEAPTFFTISPNLFSGCFFFYFGPWDRWDALRDWYLAHGLTDVHDRISRSALPEYNAEAYDGMVIDPHPGFPLLMLRTIPHTAAEIGRLVHEIHHAVQRWTTGVGIWTSRESEEVFAYFEGNLTSMVLDYLWHGTVGPGMELTDPSKPTQ